MSEGASGETGLGRELDAIRQRVCAWQVLGLRATADKDLAGAGFSGSSFPGSFIRGLFASALRRAVCASREASCGECLLASGCIYTAIFAPPDGGTSTREGPQRYVLVPPMNADTKVGPPANGPGAAGRRDGFSMKFISPPSPAIPHLAMAMMNTGAGTARDRAGRGLPPPGSRAGRDAPSFEITRIEAVDPLGRPAGLVFEAGSGAETAHGSLPGAAGRDLPRPSSAGEFWSVATPPGDGTARAFTVRFLTPLRMKDRGRISDGIHFERLLRAILRRLTGIGVHINGQSWPRRWERAIEASRRVRTADERTEWVDWKRFSKRQGRHMTLGGLVGEVTYEGDVATWLPLLRAASFFHLGKNTTFGLGCLEVEVEAGARQGRGTRA